MGGNSHSPPMLCIRYESGGGTMPEMAVPPEILRQAQEKQLMASVKALRNASITRTNTFFSAGAA